MTSPHLVVGTTLSCLAAGDNAEDDGVERKPEVDQDGDHAAHPARVHDVFLESRVRSMMSL